MNSKTQKRAPATLIQNIRHIGKRAFTLLAYWKFSNALWPILPTFNMLPGIDFVPERHEIDRRIRISGTVNRTKIL
jgi:hypothetical protein